MNQDRINEIRTRCRGGDMMHDEAYPDIEAAQRFAARMKAERDAALADVERQRIALLNVAGTARKWAVAAGGDTPLALIAQMAREALGMTVEQVNEASKAIGGNP